MTYSVGILYSGQTLLQVVEAGGLSMEGFSASFAKIEVADGGAVLTVAQKCRWISVRGDGSIRLTERGESLRSIADAQLCLREQLLDLLSADPQPWCRKLIHGRYEALKIMPDSARQCFEHCGLHKGDEDDIVDWWEHASNSARAERTRANQEVGRAAEKLTIQFETKRTGVKPVWQAIETSVSGFDVLSVVAPGATQKLKIEVKGSRQRRGEASFFVTRTEWDTATASHDFQFHLWLIQDAKSVVFVVPAPELVRHVPRDGDTGRWENAKLFFKDFVNFEQSAAFS